MSELSSGYPFDRWYPLLGKGGKEDKKIKGKAHIQIMYLPPNGKPKHDEFKYPLHSLINAKRVDLFETKISDMGGQVSDVDDKGVTPLLHAASVGAAPFVKVSHSTLSPIPYFSFLWSTKLRYPRRTQKEETRST